MEVMNEMAAKGCRWGELLISTGQGIYGELSWPLGAG